MPGTRFAKRPVQVGQRKIRDLNSPRQLSTIGCIFCVTDTDSEAGKTSRNIRAKAT